LSKFRWPIKIQAAQYAHSQTKGHPSKKKTYAVKKNISNILLALVHGKDAVQFETGQNR
jgi:hypothetical protein